jgi:hypothetical protein
METQEMRRRQAARKRRAALRRKRIIRMRIRRAAFAFCAVCLVSLIIIFVVKLSGAGKAKAADGYVVSENQDTNNTVSGESVQGLPTEIYDTHPEWTEDFLTLNEYSRPGDALTEVNSIFVHYTANEGTSAVQNRSYFEQLKDTHERSASAHFIIDYSGEIIQCIPLDEIAYAVKTRNMDSISIECCYTSDDGSFTKETYNSLIKLLKWLTDAYNLDTDDILRHYDCGGKKCPIYYTDNPKEWEQLKKDVANL